MLSALLLEGSAPAALRMTPDVQLQIACDPVAPPDAGQKPTSRSLTVGCGCTSFDSLFSLALLAFALRRRR